MSKLWTKEEIKILKRHYKKRGANYVARFVEHSPDTIMNKARELGLQTGKFRPWQKWENNYLIRHYTNRSYTSIAKTLKRSKKSVSNRASLLKLTTKKSEKWTEQELQQLKEYYPDRKYSLKEIAHIINRSANSVLLKAQRIGIKRDGYIHRWSKLEHKYLLKNIGIKTNRKIAEHLGIKTYKVDQYLQRKGLARYKKKPEWTDTEIEFLKSNYKKMSVKAIALQLNRSLNSIKNTASWKGFTYTDSKLWSVDETNYLKSNYSKLQVKQVASNLNRSKESISGKILRMGLSKRKKSFSKSGIKTKIKT